MSRWLSVLFLLGACTANSEEVRPRASDVFFPTGVAISPDERYLFITNANSELRYDSGSIGVIDLESVDQVAQAWIDRDASYAVPPGCQIDNEQRETLNCDDGGDPAPVFVLADAGVRIGNFASAIGVQQMSDPTQLRLIVAVRGDPSITYADWDGGAAKLGCSSETVFPLCDEDHRLNHLRDVEELTIPDEPFQVFVDSTSGFAGISHLTTGSVTLVDTPPEVGSVPRLTDILTGLFDADANGARGAAGIAGRAPNSAGADILYVTSRTEDRVQMLSVAPGGADGVFFVPSNFFFLDGVGGNNGGSADTRYAQFDASGDRLYLVNRQPPSLQVYDTAIGPTGFPNNQFLAATDLCREASNMVVDDVGDGIKAFVTCFRDGEVYVIDAEPNPEVEAIVTVGRGPFGIAVSRVRRKLYVTNFLEDTIAVIELDPSSALRYQVVLRIGVRR